MKTFVFHRYVYIYIPQTVLAQLRGSYFASIVIPLCSRIAGGQPKYLSLKYLSPAADSLCSRIAGRQPRYLSLKYLSSAVDSLYFRIAGRQPRYLSLKYLSQLLIVCIPGLLVVSLGT